MRAVVLCGLALTACTTANTPPLPERGSGDASSIEQGSLDAVVPAAELGLPDRPRHDAFACVPGAFLACKTGTQLLLCSSTGTGTAIVDCSPYACDAAARRCAQCDPKTQPVCQGNELVLCTAEGLLVQTLCPAGCVAGACVSCSKSAFYLDADKDGFGNPAVKVDACAQPVGYVANGSDCDDSDPAAHPGQVAFFNVPTKGTKTFDYNCDGIEEKQHPGPANCVPSGMTCVGDGWVGTVPACGAVGTWGKCNKQGAGQPACGLTHSQNIQSCR